MSIEEQESVYGSTENRTFVTRAVVRPIEAGSSAECAAHCGDRITFKATTHPKQVIVNLYEEGVWQNTIFYHLECYQVQEKPHGSPFNGIPLMTLQDYEAAGEPPPIQRTDSK